MGTGTAIQAADARQMSFVFRHNAPPALYSSRMRYE